jgi:hypothetical protein
MSTKTRAEKKCPACGMTKDEWTGNGGDGVSRGGELYCCNGCANDTGCTCG